MDGRLEVTGGKGRGRKQLLDDLLRKREYTESWKRNNSFHCGEMALEQAVDLS